jgi:acyl-CoA thioester hydrolase
MPITCVTLNAPALNGCAIWVSAKLDDMLELDIALVQCKRASMVVAQSTWRRNADTEKDAASGADLLVSAEVRLACLDAKTLRPVALPANIYNTLSET